MKKNWYSITASTGRQQAKVAIYDEIGSYGVSSTAFYNELVVATGKSGPVAVHINSPGGNIYDGIAIYNMLKAHPGRVTVRIDGLAASMASIVAMAGDEIVIPENAMIMIHNPSGLAAGGADDMRDYADLLDKWRDSMVAIYAERTKLPESVIVQAMQETTWYNGREAVEMGFADRLAESVRLAACADLGSYAYIPDTVAGSFAKRSNTPSRNDLNVISALASFAKHINQIKLGE